MSKIKIGIVGTGGMGEHHIRVFTERENLADLVELVGISDINESRAKELCEKYSIPKYFTDYKKLFEEGLDAVVNVTPDNMHHEVALYAASKGIHILSEKPLALNYKDAKEMQDAVESKGLINMVNLSYRNSSAIQELSEMTKAGELGEITHIEASYLQSWVATKIWGDMGRNHSGLWRQSEEWGSMGTLGDIGVHIFDFASFGASLSYKTVQCQMHTFNNIKGKDFKLDGKDYSFTANDTFISNVTFENDAMGVVHATRMASGQANSVFLRVYGTKGAAIVDLDKSYNEILYCGPREIDRIESNHKWKTIICQSTPSNNKRFIQSILDKKNDSPNFKRGAEMQKVIDACLQSNVEKKIIEL